MKTMKYNEDHSNITKGYLGFCIGSGGSFNPSEPPRNILGGLHPPNPPDTFGVSMDNSGSMVIMAYGDYGLW